MLLRAAICDDNQADAEQIRSFMEQYEMQYDIDFKKSLFVSPTKMLEAYHGPGTFHIAFLDIEMSELNGLELAETIRDMDDRMLKIVFVSNYPRYMQDSFPVHPVHYLVKPLTYKEFTKVMGQIRKELEEACIYKTLIKKDGEEEFINIHDILYIEALKDKRDMLSFHMTDSCIETTGFLKDWEDALLSQQFFSPHRGVLLNLKHIHFLKDDRVILRDGTELLLSRRKAKELHTILSRQILSFRQEEQ